MSRRLVTVLATALLAVLGSACGGDGPIPRVDVATPTPKPSMAAASPSTSGGGTAATSPSPASVVSTRPAPPPSLAPVPVHCSPPSAQPAGTPQGSNLDFAGACTFVETARVSCSTQPDDFLLQFQRDTDDGPKLYFHLNIEFYKGPGAYSQNVQMIFEIADNGTIYEWDTQNGSTTVDDGARSGRIDHVALPADPGTPTRGTITVDGSFACA